MLVLADKLANIRSLVNAYSEQGDKIWESLTQKDPAQQHWYFQSVAELLELSLNKTGAFKELIKHINFLWPGSFSLDKVRYKEYREMSVEGCKVIGRGAKGEVYRYDDEVVIKVYNENNTYADVEREIALARRAFILGIPTAISFGIVAVGKQYGAMYELVQAETLSSLLSRHPRRLGSYAGLMAELANTIHHIEVTEEDDFPRVDERVYEYIDGGIGKVDEALAAKCRALIDALPRTNTLLHGDFHTGNVFLKGGEPILIDMDRLSIGHPIIELSDLCYFYNILGLEDPSVVERFMGFSYDQAKIFYHLFLRNYMESYSDEGVDEAMEKTSIIGYSRLIRKLRKKGTLTEKDEALIKTCTEKIAELTDKWDTLEIG